MTTPNPHKMGLPLKEARRKLRENPVYVQGWGREELHPYIVSRRHVMAEWPVEDKDLLDKYRRRHDAGEVSMCQGRDGEYIIQYAIPTKQKARREPWFTGGTVC